MGLGAGNSPRLPDRTQEVSMASEYSFTKKTAELEKKINERKLVEKALRKNRESLKITLQTISDAVIATDADGKVTHMNRVAEELTGYSLEEAADHPLCSVFNIVNAQTRDSAENNAAKVIQTGAIVGVAKHTMIISKYGTEHQIIDSRAPICTADGNIVGVVIVFRDITDDCRMRGELDRLSVAVAQSIDGIAVADMDGNIKFANPAWAQMHGYRVEELPGKHLSSFHTQEQLQQDVNPFNERVLQVGAHHGEIGHVRKDGSTFPTLMTTALLKDEAGNPIGLVGTARDITERKLAEEDLRKSKEQFQALVESSSDWIWEVNRNGVYTYVSPKVEEILEYKPEEVVGKTPFDLMPPEEAERIAATFKRLIGRREPIVALENVNLHKDGRRVVLETSGVPVLDSAGNVQGYRGVDRDITLRKKTEEGLQRMQRLESIGTLAGGIAHDFNNILMGLFGNISIAKGKLSKDHPAFKSLEKAEQAMDSATHLTSQLMTFAKGGEPVKKDVSLGELVGEVSRFHLSGSNVMLVFEQAEDLWMAEVDKGQVQQVFSNLTINANQAMPDGGHFYITLENTNIPENAMPGLNQGRYIKVTVQDEGIGIDKKHLDRIFELYFSTRQTGSGLGLAMVYSIVNKHGGHISADSELGKGTTFTLYLPASESQRLPETKQSAAERSTIEQPARILVMDDEEIVRDVATEMLKESGFSVETAPNGKQAIEMYKQSLDVGEPFDVVIMDLTIPGGIGGKEAIKGILEIDPEAMAIVSSGYADDPVMANYAEFGFKGIAAKPYTMSKLREVLSQVLKK